MNFATEENGCQILWASSDSWLFPKEEILTEHLSTSWKSTGMFPQIIVLSFKQPLVIEYINLVARGVREVMVEVSPTLDPTAEWIQVSTMELEQEQNSQCPQAENLVTSNPGVNCSSLRLTVMNGYSTFCNIYNLKLFAKEA
eukprot:snap_masked-scaffold_2-processed-gene-25.15-mRNA-1 protein AED:1.00 eAED:1.00 QI:0/0/0/0/1/1/2/0/141